MNVRILGAAIVFAMIGGPAHAADFTYSDWQQASEEWKRGYAFAVMSFQTQVARSDRPEDVRAINGFRECVNNKMTDAAFVQVMDNYLIRHPEAVTQPIMSVALNGLVEVCLPYLRKKPK